MSKSTFTHEKLRELIFKVLSDDLEIKEGVIEEWLEQNQPAPQVVGLTEKQIKRLVAYIDVSGESLYDDIVTFLETQTFIQPEVKEVVVGLSDVQIEHLGRLIEKCYGKIWTGHAQSTIANYLYTQTFTQPEPVVVGLSDVQVEHLVKGLSIATTGYQFKNRLEFAREWLAAQTFVKPDVGISDTRPNWDDADKTCNHDWCDKQPIAKATS